MSRNEIPEVNVVETEKIELKEPRSTIDRSRRIPSARTIPGLAIGSIFPNLEIPIKVLLFRLV